MSRLQFPDIYIILFGFILISASLSWVIPPGAYDRTALPNGRQVVIADTYHPIEPSPVGFMDIVEAIPKGMESAATVIFLTLLVGGAVIVLQMIGVIDMGIYLLLGVLGRRTEWMIPILVLIFGAICAFIGTPELAIAYIPIILPLMLRLGYDSMTAAATALIPCTLGFAFGITSPANIGIGHMITGLPMFSGAGYRLMTWALMMVAVIIFLMRYARKIKKDPSQSLMYEDDQRTRAELLTESNEGKREYTARLKWAGLSTLIMFIAIIASIMYFRLGFNAISGLFVGMAVIASVIAGRGGNQICNDFNEAMRQMLVGALICGVARGVSVVLEGGQIMDTLVYYLAAFVTELPHWSASVGIVISQTIFNFLVPSGSGQMLVTLPILSPVASLSGMNQQVLVWSSHVADGISNIFFPTSGYFMAALVAARVDYIRWVKFYFPFFIFTIFLDI